MKKDKLMEYIFSIILCIILFFDLFVLNVFNNKHIFAAFLLIYFLITRIFIKPRNKGNTNKKKIILTMAALSIIYVLILYVIGIFAGFYKNSIAFNIKEFFNRILPISLIIILSELIRDTFVTRKNKISTIITTIGLILVDILLNIHLYSTINLESILTLIGYVGLSSISSNLLCNYIVKRYGYIPNIIIRIITTMNMYILPIIPDIYIFFQSVFKIMYPFIIYLTIDYVFTTENFKLAVKNQKTSVTSLVICIVIVFAIVALISCKFRYGIMVVGSSSMTGSINKGDAILFEQYKTQKLEEGQVIVFYKDGIQTIHRIQDIQILNGETIYYTKGDNNQQKDDGYRTEDEILGIVKFKLNYIGWPTIWVNQFFST